MRASDIVHVVSNADANIHWVYFRDGRVMQWNPLARKILKVARLPAPIDIESAFDAQGIFFELDDAIE